MQRRPLFLASCDWITIPWTYIDKDLFDYSYDLLVQIPQLLASLDGFKEDKISLPEINAEICGFIVLINKWKEDYLFPAASLLTQVTEWDLETVMRCVETGVILDFTFARSLTHYLAAILLIARFSQRYEKLLPVGPHRAIQGILLIIRKHALGLERGALWPWIQPLRIAHFSSSSTTFADIVGLSVQLQRRFSWPILESERYELYARSRDRNER